ITEKARLVRTETANLIKYMDDISKEMIDVTGGYDDDSVNYKGGKEEEKIDGMMLGAESSKKGKGYDLEKKLNEYQTYLNGLGLELKIPKLAVSGQEDPLAMKDPNQKRKDFAQLNFAETPMVAALA